MSAAKSFYVVIAGAGGGLGRALALRFSKQYSVAVLARTEDSYNATVKDIVKSGGHAIGVKADVTSPSSLKSAFDTISSSFPNQRLATAIFNPSGGFSRKPFFETSAQEYITSFDVQAKGLFNFAHATLPLLLLSAGKGQSPHPPSLLVTGATASLRGSANFSAFSSGKFAQRALTQSLAREFGPQGVHVGYLIVDGVISGPRTEGFTANNGIEEGKIDPGAIAEAFWGLHAQPRSAFTHELDIRPYVEKF